ncbi:hypothetical protein SAMN06265338_1406 [Rhodoblastus acidophilus]|uniref:Uncharacterized protein n=1 Tax=Rhodoblastus acidophilus TaxID=1074 RepID=A0A212SGV2_RHOAC|nr:hypothetical protein [Rhodoblastus acidophilus]PPQ34750.1 hypothetical protein CKO16_22005 [Rhodoblastus acidophilus]RAI16549.1 hypothetical protein CH337_20840 [Rhodoblastus acidophilus]SNB84836.1 hypothetical protein SAMN06265338_1406 [Rhodoblastus acidophilus]
MTDLPWAPATGQTSLRVVERSEAFVLCEDKNQFALRTLWRLNGDLVAIGGTTLTLTPKVMKPESAPEPEQEPAPPPAPAPAASTKPARGRKPEPAQMSLF